MKKLFKSITAFSRNETARKAFIR